MLILFQRIIYWLPAAAISLAILTISSIQNPPNPQWNISFLDKIAHIIIYLPVGFCYFYSFTKGFQKTTSRKILMAFLASILFGALDEFYQSFIPTRFPEFLDWLADVFGISCGFLIAFICKKFIFKS